MTLPAGFPERVAAFAVDLDRTLIGTDALLRPRTIAAIGRSRAAGVPVIVATGRMFRSVRPYLERAGIDHLVVCYQGAAVVDPTTATFLLHQPLQLDVAREAVELLQELGYPPNVYVDDELYVAEPTPYSDAYAGFQNLPVTAVGDLLAWLDRPPTKLVAVGEPHLLIRVREQLRRRLGDRAYLVTSLPHLLEVGRPGISKATGIVFVADRLGLAASGIVAFGDGENDVEMIAAAGFGIAVGDANPALLDAADWTCPGPEHEGVATVIDAYLDVHSLP